MSFAECIKAVDPKDAKAIKAAVKENRDLYDSLNEAREAAVREHINKVLAQRNDFVERIIQRKPDLQIPPHPIEALINEKQPQPQADTPSPNPGAADAEAATVDTEEYTREIQAKRKAEAERNSAVDAASDEAYEFYRTESLIERVVDWVQNGVRSIRFHGLNTTNGFLEGKAAEKPANKAVVARVQKLADGLGRPIGIYRLQDSSGTPVAKFALEIVSEKAATNPASFEATTLDYLLSARSKGFSVVEEQMVLPKNTSGAATVETPDLVEAAEAEAPQTPGEYTDAQIDQANTVFLEQQKKSATITLDDGKKLSGHRYGDYLVSGPVANAQITHIPTKLRVTTAGGSWANKLAYRFSLLERSDTATDKLKEDIQGVLNDKAYDGLLPGAEKVAAQLFSTGADGAAKVADLIRSTGTPNELAPKGDLEPNYEQRVSEFLAGIHRFLSETLPGKVFAKKNRVSHQHTQDAILANGPIAPQPIQPGKPKLAKSVDEKRQLLQELIAAKNDVRYYLNSVFMDGEHGRIAATNGIIMAAINDSRVTGEPVILDADGKPVDARYPDIGRLLSPSDKSKIHLAKNVPVKDLLAHATGADRTTRFANYNYSANTPVVWPLNIEGTPAFTNVPVFIRGLEVLWNLGVTSVDVIYNPDSMLIHLDSAADGVNVTMSAVREGTQAHITALNLSDGEVVQENTERPAFATTEDTATNTALTEDEAMRLIDEVSAAIRLERTRVVPVESFADLPADIQREAKSQGAEGKVKGVYLDGQVYVVLDQITSAQDVEEVLMHEGTHLGGRLLLGKQIVNQYNRIYDALQASGIKAILSKYGVDMDAYFASAAKDKDKQFARFMLVDEMFSHLNQAAQTETGLKRIVRMYKELIGQLRNALRKAGFKYLSDVSDSDLLYAAKRMREQMALNTAATESGKPAFMVGGTDSRMVDKIEVDGVMRHTTNSEGKPIHPTEEGIRNFWRWFSGSKVVDAEGRPLVVYHGTGADFDAFDENLIWLAESAGVASDYASTNDSGNVMPVYAAIRSPADAEQFGNAKQGMSVKEKRSAARELLSSEGFDGVSMGGRRGGFVAFNPNQIKSATGNNGNFSQTDDRIAFSLAGANAEPDYDEAYERMTRQPTFTEKLAKFWKKNFGTGGNLDQRIFEESLNIFAKRQDAELVMAHTMGKLQRALKADYGEDFAKLSAETRGIMLDWLQGRVPENYEQMTPDEQAEVNKERKADGLGPITPMHFTLPSATKDLLGQMRSQIDAMSGRAANLYVRQANDLMEEAGLTNEQISDIREELDTIDQEAEPDLYKATLRILRKVVGEANAAQHDAVMKAGMVNVIRQGIGSYTNRSYQVHDDKDWHAKVPREVFDAAMEMFVDGYKERGLSDAEAIERAEATINLILKDGTAFESIGSFITQSKLGAMDLSIMKRRKTIDPRVRALMGEYKDVPVIYTKTLSKQAALVANGEFLQAVKDQFMGVLFFKDGQQPAWASSKLSTKNNKAMEPLNGLRTSPEMAEAFNDFYSNESMEGAMGAIIRANAVEKMFKTVLAPTTQARNFQSSGIVALANGHLFAMADIKNIGKSWQYVKERMAQKGSDGELSYYRKLVQLKVLLEAPYAAEAKKYNEDAMAIGDSLFGDSKAKEGLKWVMDKAQTMYQIGDDFWRIIAWESERRGLIEAGFSENDADVEAARRIRMTYPTYALVGKAIQRLSRFPFVGTFPSFPAEILRVQYNMVKLAWGDMQSDNPAMRKLGYRRALGMVAANGLVFGMAAITAAAMGLTDEEEEVFRRASAPWNRNSTLWYFGREDNGALRVVDMSYTDPFSIWKRPFHAFARNEPTAEMAAESFNEFIKNFVGMDMATSSIIEVITNKKFDGGEVYRDDLPASDRAIAITEHLWKDLSPGFVSNLDRFYKAGTDQVSKSGREYTVGDEVAGLLGWRVSTFDPKQALYYRSYEFRDRKMDAHSLVYDKLRDPNNVDQEDVIGAYERTLELRQKAYQDMNLLVESVRNTGVSTLELRRLLKSASLSEDDIKALLSGEVPRWKPTGAAQRNALRRAELLYGADAVRRIEERFNSLR